MSVLGDGEQELRNTVALQLDEVSGGCGFLVASLEGDDVVRDACLGLVRDACLGLAEGVQ
jgi:hypothetical protein